MTDTIKTTGAEALVEWFAEYIESLPQQWADEANQGRADPDVEPADFLELDTLRNLRTILAALRQPAPAMDGGFEARFCPGIPTACCDYGVISHKRGVEICRVWTEDDARLIADLLNGARAAAPDTPVDVGLVEELTKYANALRSDSANKPDDVPRIAVALADLLDRGAAALSTPTTATAEGLLREARLHVSTLAMYDGSAPLADRFVSIPAIAARRAKRFLPEIHAFLADPTT